MTGTFTATVNAELQAGTLEETITVTGESPIVDVRSVTRRFHTFSLNLVGLGIGSTGARPELGLVIRSQTIVEPAKGRALGG